MAFTHVMVGAKDPAQGKAFYDAALGALGWPAGHEFRPGTVFYSHNGAAFGVGAPADGNAATHANGGTCSGEPGKRPGAPGIAYGAYLRDPMGNKICAFCQLPEGE